MSQRDVITYGVFILDWEEWRQVSEHRSLPQAIERACESHEILGTQIRVQSSVGIVLLEFPQRRGVSRNNLRRILSRRRSGDQTTSHPLPTERLENSEYRRASLPDTRPEWTRDEEAPSGEPLTKQ